MSKPHADFQIWPVQYGIGIYLSAKASHYATLAPPFRDLATFPRRFSADSAPPACRALHIDMTGRRHRHICGVVWFCRAQRRKAGGAPARAGRA